MHNLIFGVVGILWGGLILIGSVMRGGPQGEGAYFVGQVCGDVFGLLLLVAGIYYAIDGVRKVQAGSEKKQGKRERRRPEPDDEDDY